MAIFNCNLSKKFPGSNFFFFDMLSHYYPRAQASRVMYSLARASRVAYVLNCGIS